MLKIQHPCMKVNNHEYNNNLSVISMSNDGSNARTLIVNTRLLILLKGKIIPFTVVRV